MSRWIITTALLAGVLALGACNGEDASTPDAGAPDTVAVADAAPPEARADAPWALCQAPSGERLCLGQAGATCCLKAASFFCPPTHTCKLASCASPPDAGMPCPAGSFWRCGTGCTGRPAFGTPCACEGECVTSCDPLPKCAW